MTTKCFNLKPKGHKGLKMTSKAKKPRYLVPQTTMLKG